MTLDKINTVYFLGIGGIGMSALARFFLLQGKQVYGYDLTSTEITSQLASAGAHILFEEDVAQIPKNVDVVVYTPAVPKEHAAYQYFVEHKIPILKRSEILGMICNQYSTIAIAGTHGKTTTTAMVTQMLVCGVRYEVCGFIGGIAKNFGSNFVCEENFDTIIVEADEFDRSFLTLYPQVAVITSMDADHLDIYDNHEHLKTSFQLFANQIQPDGTLVIYDEIAHQITHLNKITYGFSDEADYQITNIQYFSTKTTFDLKTVRAQERKSVRFDSAFCFLLSAFSPHTSHLTPLTVNIPGKHNVLNAVAAIAASLEFYSWRGMDFHFVKTIIKRIEVFSGVKRRFDIRIQRDDLVYIDDYAHHPEEIKAFLEAVAKCYPAKKLTGIFQPHLYSRTRDFANEFAEALAVLDEIILLDIYPAREQPIEGITSDYLLSLIKNENKKLLSKEALITYLQQNKPEVLLTMGAGDIDRIVGDIEAIFAL
jgi:UDP-N-acetylmuramate--alanine ligase